MRLFKRKLQLLIGKAGTQGFLLEDIRVAFDITMNDKKECNDATISIYNLSQEKIGLLDDKDISVTLKVGYGEEDLSVIFIGDITEVKSETQDVDLITTVTLKDGYIPMSRKKLSLSFSANSNTKQILDKIVGEVNLSKDDYSKLPNFSYKQGFSFLGSPSQALDLILNRIGYEWTIANNALIISQNNKTNKTVYAQLLTPETGLLDTPQRFKQEAVKKKSKKSQLQDGWRFSSLLLAGLLPKNLVKVESPSLQGSSGIFIIKQIRFIGDTHGDEWKSEIEAIER